MARRGRGALALVVLALRACAATDSGAECDTKFRDRGVADFFFDEDCVADMRSHKYDCPTSTVNDFVREFIVPLRSDWVVGSFVMMVLSVMLTQLGGIPRAHGWTSGELDPDTGDDSRRGDDGNWLGDVLWGSYFATLIVQWLLQLGSVVMIVISFVQMRAEFRPCMQPWRHGMKMLDVTALPIFPFTPVVLFPLLGMWVTWAVIVEAVKVRCGSKRVEPRSRGLVGGRLFYGRRSTRPSWRGNGRGGDGS